MSAALLLTTQDGSAAGVEAGAGSSSARAPRMFTALKAPSRMKRRMLSACLDAQIRGQSVADEIVARTNKGSYKSLGRIREYRPQG